MQYVRCHREIHVSSNVDLIPLPIMGNPSIAFPAVWLDQRPQVEVARYSSFFMRQSNSTEIMHGHSGYCVPQEVLPPVSTQSRLERCYGGKSHGWQIIGEAMTERETAMVSQLSSCGKIQVQVQSCILHLIYGVFKRVPRNISPTH